MLRATHDDHNTQLHSPEWCQRSFQRCRMGPPKDRHALGDGLTEAMTSPEMDVACDRVVG